MLYPERGEQMSFMVQALVLFDLGRLLRINVLPGWLQAVSYASPATYMLRGIRDAIIDGRRACGPVAHLAILAVFGAVMIPGALATFSAAERWAKKTGRLKRQGYARARHARLTAGQAAPGRTPW